MTEFRFLIKLNRSFVLFVFLHLNKIIAKRSILFKLLRRVFNTHFCDNKRRKWKQKLESWGGIQIRKPTGIASVRTPTLKQKLDSLPSISTDNWDIHIKKKFYNYACGVTSETLTFISWRNVVKRQNDICTWLNLVYLATLCRYVSSSSQPT